MGRSRSGTWARVVKCEVVLNDPTNSDPSTAARGPVAFIRRHWLALLVVLVIVVLLFALVKFIQHKQPLPVGAPGGGRGGQNGPVAVAVATATVGDIQLRIPALGTVTPLANVTVRTQISGVMQKSLFPEGQTVHLGDSLAQIDPRPYEAALQQMQGNLRRDQALLADAQLDLKRYEGLVKEDSIAQQQLDTQRALVDQFKGTVEADEGQLKTAQVNLIYTHIISPVSGRVGLRQVDQGNYVTPGDANGIVVINQLQPITVIFSIPEDNVSALMRRLHDGGPMTVEAYDRANSAKLADGKLLTVDNEIDVTTGTVKLRAQFENTDGLLFPNQFVNVQLLMQLLHDQVIMPNSAVRRGAPNGVVSTFVYIVGSDHKVAVRPVTLGVVDGERVAVTKGLGAGEMVVTEGGDRLREGAEVLLPDAAAKPAAGAPGTAPRLRHPVLRDLAVRTAHEPTTNQRHEVDRGRERMNPSRIFILRPVATTLLMVAILIVGAIAYLQLPLSALPEVAYPTIQVQTFYPGASPEVITSANTAPLEKQFGQMPGHTQMSSTSSAGASVITLQFNLALAIDVAEQQVQAAISGAQNLLPQDLPAPPIYAKVNPADAPVLILGLTSKVMPLTEVQDLADTRIAQKISQIKGVGVVSISGGQRPAVRVVANPRALAAYGLNLDDLRTTINNANQNGPKGTLDGPSTAYTVDTNDQIRNADDYGEVVVAYKNGAPVRLKDVATLVSGAENTKLGGWMNGVPALILNVQRQPGANGVDVVNSAEATACCRSLQRTRWPAARRAWIWPSSPIAP